MARAVFVLLLAGTLAACDSRAADFPTAEDFCRKAGRQIPTFDKMVTALEHLYGQNRLPSYLTRSIANRVGAEPNPERIRSGIAAYLREEPLCCQLLRPDHLGDRIWNDEAWMDDVGYQREFSWGYIGDLYVFNHPKSAERPFYEIKGSIRFEDIELQRIGLQGGKFTVVSPGSVWMMNNCGETRNFNRG